MLCLVVAFFLRHVACRSYTNDRYIQRMHEIEGRRLVKEHALGGGGDGDAEAPTSAAVATATATVAAEKGDVNVAGEEKAGAARRVRDGRVYADLTPPPPLLSLVSAYTCFFPCFLSV